MSDLAGRQMVLVTLSESDADVYHRIDSGNPDRSECGRLKPSSDHISDSCGRQYHRKQGHNTAAVPRTIAEDAGRRPCHWCYDNDSRSNETKGEVCRSIRYYAGLERSDKPHFTKDECEDIRDALVMLTALAPDGVGYLDPDEPPADE